jgi:membrane fusion protein, multidrug efflux system
VELDRAKLAQAQLNLSYTHIVAPVDGMVGALGTQAGNYVTPGSALMSVVPLNDVYIEADYREVDLIHVERGQPVHIHVDAYDLDLRGTVDSVPPATGTTFAPVQPENATGNFTKIVQRLPVKIVVNAHQDAAKLLRVGLSVETTIDTHSADVAADQHGHESPVTAAPEGAPGVDPGSAR